MEVKRLSRGRRDRTSAESQFDETLTGEEMLAVGDIQAIKPEDEE